MLGASAPRSGAQVTPSRGWGSTCHPQDEAALLERGRQTLRPLHAGVAQEGCPES